jgi:hypothetical protein
MGHLTHLFIKDDGKGAKKVPQIELKGKMGCRREMTAKFNTRSKLEQGLNRRRRSIKRSSPERD